MDEGALLSYFSSPKFTLPPAIRGNLNIIRMPYIKSTIYPFHVATMSAPAGSRQNKQPRGACTERLSTNLTRRYMSKTTDRNNLIKRVLRLPGVCHSCASSFQHFQLTAIATAAIATYTLTLLYHGSRNFNAVTQHPTP